MKRIKKTKETTAEKQYQLMTHTPIPVLATRLGIPTTISMLVSNIYNMADTYFVGREGTSASGAIGIVFGLMAIIQAFGFASFLSMLRSGLYFIPVLIILPRLIGLRGAQMASMVGDILTWGTTIPFLVSFFRKLPKVDETFRKP